MATDLTASEDVVGREPDVSMSSQSDPLAAAAPSSWYRRSTVVPARFAGARQVGYLKSTALGGRLANASIPNATSVDV